MFGDLYIPDWLDIVTPARALVIRDAVPAELQVPIKASDTRCLGAAVLVAQTLVIDHVDDRTDNCPSFPGNPV